jgi:hypothetical protein
VQLPAFIYDLENQTLVRELALPGPGDFSLTRDASLIAVDEKILVPNLLRSGQTVGVRYKKTGFLRVYDAMTGKGLAAARLPEDGQLSAIEEWRGYYVSPSLLSVVDLRDGRTIATARLPISSGFVAFHDERER